MKFVAALVLLLPALFASTALATSVGRDVRRIFIEDVASLADVDARRVLNRSLDARANPSSALANPISHVVGVRSEKQVVDVDALFSVASMEHLKFVWDCSVDEFPSEAVGAFANTNPVACADDESVAVAFTADPEKAPCVWLRNGSVRKPLCPRLFVPSVMSYHSNTITLSGI